MPCAAMLKDQSPDTGKPDQGSAECSCNQLFQAVTKGQLCHLQADVQMRHTLRRELDLRCALVLWTGNGGLELGSTMGTGTCSEAS